MSIQRGRDEWVERVEAHKKSGLSQREFAEQRSISYYALAYWILKLRKEERAKKSSHFLPVTVVASAAPSARVAAVEFEATLPTGIRLRFQVGTDPQYLAQLLSALR